MSGIAFKIFLSFWIIFAVLIASFALVRDRGQDFRAADLVRQDAIVAAALFEEHGPEACETFLLAVKARTRLAVALVDGNARIVCGQPAADDAASASPVAVSGPSRTQYQVRGAVLSGFEPPVVGPPFPYRPLGLAIVISGLVCFIVAAYLARPIRRVRDASKRMAAGDLAARAGTVLSVRKDELGDMVRDFDAMAARIEGLVNSQNQLLLDISHELRSPLARLNVALELANRRAGEGMRDHLDRIEVESGRMNDLVGRLLALTRAETAAPLESPTADVDLVALVTKIAADANYEAQRQSKSVTLTGPDQLIIRGNAELLASAIDNIVRNAVRHAPAHSPVEVTVTTTAQHAVVTIRDHGPGVPPGEVDRIFFPFYRVESARNRAAGGAGLGLTIAQRAIAVHKGSIEARNAADGGLMVSVHLPLVTERAAS